MRGKSEVVEGCQLPSHYEASYSRRVDMLIEISGFKSSCRVIVRYKTYPLFRRSPFPYIGVILRPALTEIIVLSLNIKRETRCSVPHGMERTYA